MRRAKGQRSALTSRTSPGASSAAPLGTRARSPSASGRPEADAGDG